MNRITFILLFVVAGSLSSCSLFRSAGGKKNKRATTSAIADTSKTNIVATDTVQPHRDTVYVKAVFSPEEVKLRYDLLQLWKKRLVYNNFSGKAKVHFEGPDGSKDFTAHIRVRKDSVIWINITALGSISFARLLITTDSIFMVNHLQKEVTMIPLTQAAKILPTNVDFASLQNLILGEPLRDGNIEKATDLPGIWSMQVEDSSYIQHVTYSKADSSMSTCDLATRKPNGPQAKQEYKNYELLNNRKISTGRMVNIQNGSESYILELDIQKAEFDQPLEYPFSIPKNYSVK